VLRQGIDYDSYKLSVREIVTGIAVYSVIAVMVSVLFFDSLIPCLVFTPGILVFLRKIADGKCRQRKNKLNNEFKEMLLSLSANMAGGGLGVEEGGGGNRRRWPSGRVSTSEKRAYTFYLYSAKIRKIAFPAVFFGIQLADLSGGLQLFENEQEH